MKPADLLPLVRGYPGRLWLACFGAYALSQMDLALWSYALPLIRRDLDLTRTQGAVMVDHHRDAVASKRSGPSLGHRIRLLGCEQYRPP